MNQNTEVAQPKRRRNINEFNIPFLHYRRITTILSVLALIACCVSFYVKGLNWGLDFTGGTVIEVAFEHPITIDEISQDLSKSGFGDAILQYVGSTRNLMIRLPLRKNDTSESSAKIGQMILNILENNVNQKVTLSRAEFVGPQVGDELRQQGLLAVLFSLIGILIYVSLRFEWRLGLGAINSLFHDVVFTMGVFSFLQLPFDLTVLAAVLAVIGYSLNDTIVIFDRIRENARKIRRSSMEEISNISVNQTLSRTIITSGSTLMVLVVLFFFGGEAIHYFSLALIIGILVGTYSTIYIATSTILWLKLDRSKLVPAPVNKQNVDATTAV